MELIIINENKLKITLSEFDMKEYCLDCSTIDYDNTETRRAFWSILDEVKHKTGFDAASQKVFIQLYPSKEGGCEMYVTKLGEKPTNEDTSDPVPDSHRLRPIPKRQAAYSFSSLSRLISVCKRLSGIGFSEKSAAYRSHIEENKYFLILDEPEEITYLPVSEFSFICEYGKSENLKNTMLFIHEHADPICQSHAIETLSSL